MIARLAVALALLAAALAHAMAQTQPRPEARIVYIGQSQDPFYEPRPVYTGLSLKDRHRPVAGAELAVRDARVLARALGVAFELEVVLLEPGAPAAPAVSAARAAGALAVLLDLPADSMAAVVAAEGDVPTLSLINVRHSDMRWRGADCAAALLHTFPSRAMLDDALAQHLRGKGWDQVLLLAGPTSEDQAAAASARRSAAKFGLTIRAERVFELSNDPRQRESNNVALMTGGVRYDVIWLIDTDGEFGRYVPFATYLPRPVVGGEGLTPHAWHWTYERHGAPQLNQRFQRLAGRDMSSGDWAAWAAVRAVVESVSRVGGADRLAVTAHLTSPDLSLDLYKGVPGSFRPWSGQLRQPILLATHNAVTAVAPLEGFQHETNTLDTLGIDRTESLCPARG